MSDKHCSCSDFPAWCEAHPTNGGKPVTLHPHCCLRDPACKDAQKLLSLNLEAKEIMGDMEKEHLEVKAKLEAAEKGALSLQGVHAEGMRLMNERVVGLASSLKAAKEALVAHAESEKHADSCEDRYRKCLEHAWRYLGILRWKDVRQAEWEYLKMIVKEALAPTGQQTGDGTQ